MKLTPEQLLSHLQNPLQKIYLISGDEPMQKLEAADEIRKAAKNQGIEEREIIFIDAKFNWDSLLEQGSNMSLFAEKRMLDIRMEKFPQRNEQQTLLEFIEKTDDSTVVLITSNKLEAKVQKQKWAKKITDNFVWMPVWPIAIAQLPQWLIKKARQRKRQLPTDAAHYLAHQVEGNLLAAKQELDKACLMVEEGAVIECSLLEQQVSDNARFTPWELLDVTFVGDKEKIPRILQRLRQEKIEPMVLVKTLQRDILQLEKMSSTVESGQPQSSIFQEYRVWGPKQTVFAAAMKRYRSKSWQRLWVRAMSLERIVVGQKQGDFWDECLQLCLLIAGLSIWSKADQQQNKSTTVSHSVASKGAEQARAALRSHQTSTDNSNARR